MTSPALLEPYRIRGVELRNRIGVSPMCMYSSVDGFAQDFHLVHLGRFALGGAGLVIAEATAVERQGRISHHDLGIWSDAHVPGLSRIAEFIAAHGAVPGIQLAHAGRRASVREPWRGGLPLDEEDAAAGLPPWVVEGPSPLAAGPGWPTPIMLTGADIRRSVAAWADAARRAVDAGFRVIELHGAHGYLLHSFLSPISNHRTDAYGGSAAGRQRYPLEVIAAVRAAIPNHIALFYRVSSVDGVDGGLTMTDTIEFAHAAVAAGVDLIDTSSGGIVTDHSVETRVRRGFAFHADFSAELRSSVHVPTATVGLILDPEQASLLIEHGDTDLVLLGRQLLDDPNWAHHAGQAFAHGDYSQWLVQSGDALAARSRTLGRLAAEGQTPLTRFSTKES